MTRPPGNFAFLSDHAPLLAELGATAERLFPFDPASCVLKLRLLAEAITQDIAARLGLRLLQPTQAELLRAVDARLGLDPQVRDLFHLLRRTGNQAAHEAGHPVTHREGMDALRVARELAVWFHRSFGPDTDFRPGPFRLPDDPSQDLANLQQQLADLQARLHDARASQAQPPELAAMAELARLRQAEAEQERALATRAQEEAAIYQALAEEAEQRAVRLQAELQAQFDARLRAAEATAADQQQFSQRAARAARAVHLDEAATRRLIDAQLTEAGWQADSQQLTYASDARPQRGRNLAIAE